MEQNKIEKFLFEVYTKGVHNENCDLTVVKNKILDEVGQNNQFPCDCGVCPKETELQVYCPKCYKTWWMKK